MLSDHSKNEQYFEALMTASIVSKTNGNGIITYVNDNFCKITGYTREEMLGHTHAMFRHPENSDTLYQEMWETITTGKIWRERMINLNKDGSNFIAESTIIPLVDEEGNISEYLAIRNDITDLVKLKREIFLKEQEKIEHEKIRDAQKSFLLLFTHELKTPLNAIINFTKYIRKQIEKPEEIDQTKLLGLLDTVSLNAVDMLDNITIILETSKLNANKMIYHNSVFSPEPLIEELLSKYQILIHEKNIQVTKYFTSDVLIHSDEYRVKQIVANILSNAIKYGHNEIYITLFVRDKEVILTIEDNGSGIKNKEAIFELYAQEDTNVLERKGQGTGIGLYFLKLLCRDLHINYTIEDRKDAPGTKFSLRFSKNSPNKEKQ